MHAPQILVVDDDLEIRKLLARYLKEQGFYLCSTILKSLLTLNLNLCEII
jgi:DNA-binding response OmpR family regulator